MLLEACLCLALLDDPVTGVWKGTAVGSGQILPDTEVRLSLLLELGDDGRVTGSFQAHGVEVREAAGTFDADTGELTVAGSFNALPFAVTLDLSDTEVTGKLTGLGLNAPLRAERISPEVLAEPVAPSAPVDVSTLSPEDWAEDLRFLRAYLPQVHANAFHTRSSEEWARAVAALESKLAERDGLQNVVALAQLVAGVGDAHTELNWREVRGFAAYPLQLTYFADGLFVTEVDARWGEALGMRVARVGSVSADEALAAVSTVFAAENDSWRLAKAPGLLTIPQLLRVLGLLESPERLPLTLEAAPCEELEVAVEARGDGTRLRAPDPNWDPIPMWLTRRDRKYWLEGLPDAATVYVAYNTCAEDSRVPMNGFVDRVLETMESLSAERLVIDLRHNSGGNSTVLSQHLARLARHPRLDEPGRIVGLIGRSTYSSGMMNAHQLREQAGATLVGEPTGGKPNCYGELRSFRLPRSGLQVFYTIKYFRMLASDPPSVLPDVVVGLRSDEHFAGEDPVLARALELGVGEGGR